MVPSVPPNGTQDTGYRFGNAGASGSGEMLNEAIFTELGTGTVKSFRNSISIRNEGVARS
jgi:hypothetical protein